MSTMTGFPPNLKDPMHDSAMSVNATQQSSIRLAVASSAPVQAGQGSQAHHRQPLARYPFIHSEEFDQYSTYASHPCSPPLQIDQTRGSMGYIELNRKMEGGQGRQCVANGALGYPT
jgi:hypothetical protein